MLPWVGLACHLLVSNCSNVGAESDLSLVAVAAVPAGQAVKTGETTILTCRGALVSKAKFGGNRRCTHQKALFF